MRCYTVLIVATLAIATFLPTVKGQEADKGDVDRTRLQQQLSDIEQQWMAAERERKLDFLKDLWTDDFFDVLYDGPVATKEDMLKLFASTPARPGAGAFPDHFQLRSVFGNTAIATDHTVIKAPGSLDREFNCVRIYKAKREVESGRFCNFSRYSAKPMIFIESFERLRELA